MSERWPGGIVRSTPVTPTGPLQNGTAPGIWTMEQAAYWTKQGLWPTAGNFLAVEDVFSTYLYTGAGSSSSQTITNGIDLSGKGGLVWEKSRNGVGNHFLFDTVRGGNVSLASNTTSAQASGLGVTFNSSGYTYAASWATSNNVASWTFREAPKFFDVVTWTGDGVAGRQIAHNLGVTPGMVIVKRTSSAADWVVWQRTLSDPSKYLVLNTTAATATDAFGPWGPTGGGYTTNASAFTDTFFRVANDTRSNASGSTYVAYLFAHDTSSTGIIQCGSYSGTGAAGNTISLGWEPQWLLIKQSNGADDWHLFDNMRGMPVGSNDNILYPNLSNAEYTAGDRLSPTATGFTMTGSNLNFSGSTYIYIAIRRGPMKTPTLGTTVFSPVLNTGNNTAKTLTTNFVTDLTVSQGRNAGSGSRATWWDRLRGPLLGLQSLNTTAETSYTATLTGFDNNTGVVVGVDTTYGYINNAPDNFATWQFRRAPSFFDEVCYTGDGVAGRAINHNLGVTPEMMIVKIRSDVDNWYVYHSALGATKRLKLNLTDAEQTALFPWNNTAPTSTTFTVSNSIGSNASGYTYVNYLFASCPGVSKVGSYTGTGALQTINCGFTTGARFVLIKRTDSTGDWYVWDSARGITSGNDPYLLWNSNAAEVTGTNYVDTDTTGFKVTAAAPAGINANGGTYIFLAVA